MRRPIPAPQGFSFSAWLLLTALLAALSSGSAFAVPTSEEAVSESAEEEETPPLGTPVRDEIFVEDALPEIPTSNTVAAKLPLSLRKTPASVTVVTAERFEEQGAFVLGNALTQVSGMNVQTFNGVFDFFVVRGLDSVSSGLIQTDGVPEPEATFYQLYNVDRVEVLKGPSAFLYGNSPLVGTINLVRKQPQPVAFTRFGLAAGSFGTFEGTVDSNIASGDGKLSFRLNGLWQQSDGYRDNKDSDNLAVNPALSWRPNDRTAVNVNLEVVDTQYSTDSGLPILFDGSAAPVPRKRSYQSPFDISDQQLGRFQVDVETRLSDRLTLRNKTYFRSLDWLSSGTLFNGAFPDGVGGLSLSRFLTSLDNQQSFVGNQFEVLWQASTGSVTHNLLAGVEVGRRKDEFTFDVFFLPNIDVLTPVETAREPLFPLPGQATAADATTDLVAPYVIDQITFGDRFQLLVGGRFDSIDFDNTVSGIKRSDSEFSPMVGFVFAPTETLSFYANAGDAFALPSTFVVEDRRQPETSSQVEVGVKKGFRDGKVQTSLALYRIDRDNIAIPDVFGLPRQVGRQRSEGAELEISSSFGEGLVGSFTYAYTDSKLSRFTETVLVGFFPPTFVTVDRSGNTSPFAPDHLATFWLRKRFTNGFGVGGGGRYLSEQFIAENNAFAIDSYATLDAAFFYETGPWRLQLNVQNLTDKEYFTRGSGTGSVIPAPGIGAVVSAKYSL